MALKIKDNTGTIVKVPSMKEVNDRINTLIQDPTTLKTINNTSIIGTGNFALEPAITSGTTGQYWIGTKTWETPDNSPTDLSTKLITSGAVYTAIENVIAGGINFDTTIASGGSNAVKSGIIYDEVKAPLTTHTSNTTIHTTAGDKTNWNGKQNAINISGILKGDGAGGISAASSTTDYQSPLSNYSVLTSGLYKITTNNLGQVTAGTNVVKTDIVGLGIPAQDTTYAPVIPGTDGTHGNGGVDGLITSMDKFKLDNIASGAQENVIESISIGGSAQSILNKNVNLPAYPTVNNSTITVNATNTTAQTVVADTFTLNGTAKTIELHQIAKTGDYNHLSNTPDLTLKADKVSGSTAGNFAGLDANGNLTDSGSNSSNFDVAGAATTVQTNLTTHIGDTTNPHETTLSQASAAQGSLLTVIPSAGIYEGTDTSATTKNTKYQTKSEVNTLINSSISGTSKYMGQLKYGSNTTADMTSISSYNLSVGDECGSNDTQKTYVYTAGTTVNPDDITSSNSGFYWSAQTPGTDAVGQYFDIIFWFGTWLDGVTYAGDVSARITCSDAVTPVWDLIVYADQLIDGEITDPKIGNRLVTDTSTAPSNNFSAKNLTDWLQQFYSNIKYINGGKADKVSSATAGNFAGLDTNGNLTDSGVNSNSFIKSTAFNAGTLSPTSTTTVASEKSVSDAINVASTAITATIGNGKLTITLAPADGSTPDTPTEFSANQSTNKTLSINIPSSYIVGADTGGDINLDWTN